MILSALAAFAVVWAWCELVGALWPAPAGFRGQMTRMVGLMLARTLGVVAVVGAGIKVLGGNPAGSAIGALGGWAVGAGRAAWRQQRAAAREMAAGGPKG